MFPPDPEHPPMQHLTLRARWLLGAACAAIGAAASAALDPVTVQQAAGTFSNACGDRSQVMIRLHRDVLDLERGSVALNARQLVSTRKPPADAPPDFAATVQGRLASGDKVTLTITHGARGLFARIDGTERAVQPLGRNIVGLNLRHCDPNRNALPEAARPRLGAAARAGAPSSPGELLRDARFREAYLKAAGPLAKERWIAELEGPTPALRAVSVAGSTYTLAASCKPNDCAEHNLVLLWQGARAQVAGFVHQRGKSTFIGAPGEAVARELEKLWAETWRKR
jgi:hypothetical protein